MSVLWLFGVILFGGVIAGGWGVEPEQTAIGGLFGI